MKPEKHPKNEVVGAAVSVITTALARPATYVGQLREAVSLATCVARYPLGFFEDGVHVGDPGADATRDTPVLLVHGYGHNRSAWYTLERHLRAALFTRLHTVNYNPLRHSVPTLAAHLRARVETVRAATGADRVHVIGHSLGGIILRWYVQELGGDEHVDVAVTMASPHEGTHAAWIGFGRTAVQLRPGSALVRRLRAAARPSSVRWVSVYSNLDMLVQPCTSAMLRVPALRATNVLAKDHGHMAMLLSPGVARTITAQLEAAEGVAGVGTLRSLPSAAEDAEDTSLGTPVTAPSMVPAVGGAVAPPMAGR